MQVEPLAGESLGVRSFAVRMAVDGTAVLLDPGTGLKGSPQDLPHPFEYQAMQAAADRIDEAAKTADAVVITHYHFDHFVPLETDRFGKWSRLDRSREVYTGAHVFVKHPTENINKSQSDRARKLRPVFDGVADRLTLADGRTEEFGPVTLRFSPAVPHGGGEEKFGSVIMVAVEGPDETVVYTSDVGGPIEADSVTWIEAHDPDLILVDGPSLNPPWNSIPMEDVAATRANLCRLATSADLIIDHHPYRVRPSLRSPFLGPIEAAAADAGHSVHSVASYRGDPLRPLEAWRDVIHEHYPADPSFYKRLGDGAFDHEPIKFDDEHHEFDEPDESDDPE